MKAHCILLTPLPVRRRKSCMQRLTESVKLLTLTTRSASWSVVSEKHPEIFASYVCMIIGEVFFSYSVLYLRSYFHLMIAR